MQRNSGTHIFGKPLHRSSIWRRNKRPTQWSKPAPAPKTVWRKGRKFLVPRNGGRPLASDNYAATFLLFSAAVVDLWNAQGEIREHWEIFEGPRQGELGFKYRAAKPEILLALSNSGFPPPMLAVATCDLFAEHLLFKGNAGPGSKMSKLDLAARKLAILRAGPGSVEFGKAFAQERNYVVGDALATARQPARQPTTGISSGLIATDADAVRMWQDQQAELGDDAEIQEETEPGRKLVAGRRKTFRSISSIPFAGGIRIGRRAASYWRNKKPAAYRMCVEFVLRQCATPPVGTASGGVVCRPARIVSAALDALLLQGLRKRAENRRKAASVAV